MWYRSSLFILTFFVLSFFASSFLSVASATVAQIDSGRIEGLREADLTVYRGVPFAAPPVDSLRWREPQPVSPWSNVRQAHGFAPACMQSGVSMPGEVLPAVSEDCLYLNIWTPGEVNARLPVLVWIYGGGFSNGSAAMPLTWGDSLARKGIVVVTIAYRVGAFGFLAHPELTRESAHGSSGNYGLLDQIAALQWVQRNIAAFGGDPARVTIAGQSAGSMSVSILMASPLANGLFHGAIGQSGGFFEPVQLAPNYLLANAEREGEAFAASVGADSLAALRRIPAPELLNAKMPSGAHPVIEPYVLPRTPFDVFSDGQQSDIPILIGVNAEEARSLTDMKDVTAATFASDLERRWGMLPPPIVNAYAFKTDDEARQAMLDLEGDLRFGWNMWAWGRLHTQSGHSVYSYRFTRQPPFPETSAYAGWGAGHFAELWYAFDHLDQNPWPWTPDDRALAAAMSAYWANFVATGNPNANGLPAWPALATVEGPVLQLGAPISVGMVARPSNLQIFDAVYAQLRAMPLQAP